MASQDHVASAKGPAQLTVELFHETAGDEGVCGIKVARPGYPEEVARLQVSLEFYTQRTMYHLFADRGRV